MSQEAANRRNLQTINAHFRVKGAGVSPVTILIIGINYVANTFSLLPNDEPVPVGALKLVITTLVLIIVVEAALQIVLFIGAGRFEDRTGRDEAIVYRHHPIRRS